jgi:carbonic anhydrase
MHRNEALLSEIRDDAERLNRLCELNVIEQVMNVSRTTIVQNAWDRGQELAVHGWIYGIGDGLLRDLDICITNQRELSTAYEDAVRASG